ncbi:MAG: hypothetical protein JW816_03825, partial [Candidatus Buchananbacteria bacterium]|nr:hypothetical protein [Candidatus Buchananbacteria bacterium]
ATEDDSSCTYQQETSTTTPEVEDIPPAILGCTDSTANNYNSEATEDDSSCTYPILGCTDSQATNYNSEATQDDNSCIYSTPGPSLDSTSNTPEVVN